MSRAIKIFGIGFSADDTDAKVEVKIDNNVVYSGAIETDKNADLNSYLEGSSLGEFEVASWIESDASSVKQLSIHAISGNFLYSETVTTYIGEESQMDPELLGVHTYDESDGDSVSDPNYNVVIDGEIYEDGAPSDRSELYGQWNIGIPEGSIMVCDLTIDEGAIRPDPEIE